MNKSLFQDRAQFPDDEDVRAVLGQNFDIWQLVIEFAGSQIPGLNFEWKFVDRLSGWLSIVKKRVATHYVPLVR
jgi:hypothetical protein